MATSFLSTSNTSHTILLSTLKEPPPRYNRSLKTTATPVQNKTKKSLKQKTENKRLSRNIYQHVQSGRMEEARQQFDAAKKPILFLWNFMIKGYTQAERYEEAIELYYGMLGAGLKGNKFTFPFVIKSCTCLLARDVGLKVHARLLKCGLDSDQFVGNSLIAMYSKFGIMGDAEKVFDEMPVKDLVSWNSMIDAYVLNGEGRNALSCFKDLSVYLNKKHDRFGIMGVLAACSLEASLKAGREVHCYMIRNYLESDIKVQTSLLDMYCKCLDMNSAENVFRRISIKPEFAWNSLIGGYSLNEQHDKAISCVNEMLCTNAELDDVTMINLLTSCAKKESIYLGKMIHAYSIRKGLQPHIYLETALIDMYGKCNNLRLAQLLYNKMEEHNLVSWNTMCSAYMKNGMHQRAIKLFVELLDEFVQPDLYSTSTIVPAYTELASLRDGKQIHSYVAKMGFSDNVFVSNSIMYMYARCGDLKSSREVFDRIPEGDLVTWNTIMMGYGIHGHGKTALDLFSHMKAKGIRPNERTFFSVLTACSVSGLTEEGWMHFKSMEEDYDILPRTEHYGCMVDLLGRAGDLNETLKFIENMLIAPTATIWGSLLTASRNNKTLEVAELAAKKISEIEHDNTGCYVTLCNMYTDARRWDDLSRVRDLMREKDLRKTGAVSRVELSTKQYSFVNGDMSYAESSAINEASDVLSTIIGENVSTPSNVFDPIRVGKKRTVMANRHSVRLAAVFGLISTGIGSPVLVKKNVRICNDCHYALKKISKFTGREIVVGDSSIYHHFSEGSCCCNDYW